MERWNQTLKSMIVTGQKDIWDEMLPTCVFAYNTAKQETTLYTPFEIIFGRKANLPVDLDFETRANENLMIDEKLVTSTVEVRSILLICKIIIINYILLGLCVWSHFSEETATG